MATLVQPRVEAEVAFRLGEDLDLPEEQITLERVRAAVDVALPSLEIVDSRIAGWDIGFTDTVADNASSGLFVVGEHGVALSDLEPRDVEMSLTIDGEERSSGKGVACLGDPLEALRWLAVQPRASATRCGPATSCCPGRSAPSCPSTRAAGSRRPSAGSPRSPSPSKPERGTA